MASVQRRAAVTAFLVTGILAVSTHAQHASSAAVVVRVDPEASVEPRQVSLQFHVSADGSSDVTAQSAAILARVRALPGQSIHLTASLASIIGPGGMVPVSAVGWRGAASQSTGGGRQSTCTAGKFSSGQAQDLAQGWTQSGSLQCAVTFQLQQPRSLAAGDYAGTINLNVAMAF